MEIMLPCLALLIALLPHLCIAQDAVSFDHSMYVTTESSVVVMVIGDNLMEEVALSIELENSDNVTDGTRPIVTPENFTVSSSSPTHNSTITLLTSLTHDVQFTILLYQHTNEGGSGDGGSSEGMIMPYDYNSNKMLVDMAVVIFRTESTTSFVMSTSMISSGTTSSRASEFMMTSSQLMSTIPSDQTPTISPPALEASMVVTSPDSIPTMSVQPTTVFSDTTSSQVMTSSKTSSQVMTSSGSTSTTTSLSSTVSMPVTTPPPSTSSDSSDNTVTIAIVTVVVLLLLAIAVVVFIIVVIVIVRKKRRTHTYYTTGGAKGNHFNHYIDVQVRSEDDMREKTPDSKEAPLFETSFIGNGNRSSTIRLNDAYGTSSFKSQLEAAIKARSQSSQLDGVAGDPSGNGAPGRTRAREE